MPASTSQRRTKPKVRRNSDVIKLYDVKGESAAVSGGQAVTDVTPNCTVTTKQ